MKTKDEPAFFELVNARSMGKKSPRSGAALVTLSRSGRRGGRRKSQTASAVGARV